MQRLPACPPARVRGALAALLTLAGCAVSPPSPLPPAPGPHAERPAPPRIADARGVLPPARAQQVLQRLEREGDSDVLARHLRATATLVRAPLRLGNRVELLVDGPATLQAMFAAMRAARHTINLETYIIDATGTGRRLADLLVSQRRKGVQVHLVYDGIGSIGTPPEYFEHLRQAGVAVCEYNPVNPLRARGDWDLNNRDHRKILVVDGGVGFTGGINISNTYSSSSFGRHRTRPPVQDGWRDTHVQVQGPAVLDLQRLFVQTWRSQCGALSDDGMFPDVKPAGSKAVRVIAGVPGDSEVYAALLSAIERSEESVYITVGYFAPDPRTLLALRNAAARGVDVRLALPGVSDFWAPLHAGRSHYDSLLDSGVRIYERRDALLHAKTAVVDGVWSTIGSTNLDWRSFVHNDEANVEVLDEGFGKQMQDLFWIDVDQSVEITERAWHSRSAWERMKEWFARQWEYLL